MTLFSIAKSKRMRIPKMIVAGLLMFSFAFSVPTVALAQEGGGTGAIAGGVGGALACIAAGLVGSLTSVTNVPTTESSHTGKECVLDGIWTAIKEAMIAEITRSIVDWINNGFEGSPGFITDLEGFLLDIADRTAGDFIYGTDLGFLCSPFELQIRLELAQDYGRNDYYGCRLSDIEGNVEDFFQGTFSEGGWERWFDVTTRQSNNPYGALFAARASLEDRIQINFELSREQLGWGDGFQPVEECVEENEAGECTRRQTVTPANTVAYHVNEALGLPQTSLVVADSFNAVLSALFTQLARKALTGIGGLLGLGRGNGGQRSYLSQVSDETRRGALGGTQDLFLNDLRAVTFNEQSYRDTLTNTEVRLSGSRALLIDLKTCYVAKAQDDGVLPLQRVVAQSRAQIASSTIDAQIDPQLLVVRGKLAESNVVGGKIDSLGERARATTNSNELNALAIELQELVASGALHTEGDVQTAVSDAQITTAALDSLDAATREQRLECEAFPNGT